MARGLQNDVLYLPSSQPTKGHPVYAETNFKTKKALKEAVKAGETVKVFQPGGIFPGKTDGEVSLEGPHYPAPHSWWARVRIKDSKVVKVLS